MNTFNQQAQIFKDKAYQKKLFFKKKWYHSKIQPPVLCPVATKQHWPPCLLGTWADFAFSTAVLITGRRKVRDPAVSLKCFAGNEVLPTREHMIHVRSTFQLQTVDG